LSNKETTISEESPHAVQLEEITEVTVETEDTKITVTDVKEIINLYYALFHSTIKKGEKAVKEDYKSYWITIKSDKGREFGLRLDSELNVSTYDYRENKMNAKNYLFTENKPLHMIESLLQ